MKNFIKTIIMLLFAAFCVSCTPEETNVAVTSVNLDTSELNLTEGERYELKATVSPFNATNKKVIFKSGNTSVASVTETGVVTAHKAGNTKVTVVTDDGGKTATCDVTVVAKKYPVTGVKLNSTQEKLGVGETITLTATVTPSTATDKTVSWSSSNTSVATVSQNGEVSALKKGTATITVTTKDGGKTATCKITVEDKVYPVESVTLDKSTYEMTVGDNVTLKATVNPSNATDKTVSWSSSNESVATVSQNGEVSALKKGTTTITVTTKDGGKTATCKITVEDKVYPVESVTLDKSTYEMTVGDNVALKATVNPSNATDKTVSWSSNNTSVATVSQNGVVTAKKKGTAKITVTTNDGNKTAECIITVTDKVYPVESVTLDKSSWEMIVGEDITLVATVNPSNATDKTVVWNSSNTSVATVSQNGVVTAKKEGTAKITVTTNDGNKTAECMITVIKNYTNNDGEGLEDEDGEW